MRYVYILTSTEKDYYFEECLISMTSLLKYNPSAEIILLTDDRTYRTLQGFRGKVIQMASETVVRKFSDSVTQKVRSRLLKTSMRKLIKGKFIFLDLDTVITDSIDIIEYENEDIAMVLDQHGSTNYRTYMYIQMNARRAGYSTGYKNKHFNSGVIYVNDTASAYHFFELWHVLYLRTLEKGIDTDQTSLNETNKRMGGIISELNGVWNVQANCGLKYLSEAKVIHYLDYHPLEKKNIYFNTLPFELCNEKYFDDMKNRQEIPLEVINIINNPRASFKISAIIPDDCLANKLIYSNHMRILKFLYVKFNYIYRLFECVYGRLFFYIFRRV